MKWIQEIAFYFINALYGDEYAEQRAEIILEVFEILTMIGMVDKDEIIAVLAEMK